MMWFKSTIAGAGLARFGSKVVLTVLIATASTIGWLVAEIFKVPVLGLFVAIGILAFEMEALALGAKMRRRELAKLWPEVIDSINSAISSGMSLVDALDELAFRGPERLKMHFSDLSAKLDSGWAFSDAIDEFKANLGEIHADRLCEILRLVSESGSESLVPTLLRQSVNLRRDLALDSMIESKQGWVSGTAKIAVAAPWIVVALLSMRPENAIIYNSSAGALILLVGFLISVFAYRLVQIMGTLPEQPRVLTS